MDSLSGPRFCAMGIRCTQARFLDGKPSPLRRSSTSKLCASCEKAGLLPLDAETLKLEPLEPAPEGEERKARAFKDSLTVQLFLKNGTFWDAVNDLRMKRGIAASRQVPPSGPEISGLIMADEPGYGQDVFALHDKWVADLREIEERCVPARLRDAAEWKDFISVCVLFDPPKDPNHLDAFARHGDLRFFESGRPGAKGDRVPMKAGAPIRWMVADEKDAEDVHMWLLERVLDELGKRYLAPAGVDVDEAVKSIIDSTGLNNEYHQKKRDLHREWHIIAAGGVNANDVKRAADKLSTVREARSAGGRGPRSDLVALQCALLYDASEPTVAAVPKLERSRILADRYGIPRDEVDKYVERGRALFSKARRYLP